MAVLGVFLGLVPVALVIAIVVAIARAVRGPGELDWGQVVRQLFQHLVAVGLAFVAATGVSRLLRQALDGPSLVTGGDQLAVPLAFAVVGVPLYVATMWWLLGQARRDEGEADTLAWSLHLAVVGLAALVVTMVGAYQLLEGMRQPGTEWAGSLAPVAVWGGLWGWYRWLEHHRVGSSRWAVLQVIATSAIGLTTAVVGAFRLVSEALDAVWFGNASILAPADPWDSVVLLGMGFAVWAVAWLIDGMRRPRDAWWYGWVLLGGLLPAMMTMIGSAAYLLFLVAVWLVGRPADTAAMHFETSAAAAAALVVAGFVWAYHRSILAPTKARERTGVDRVHDLLLAAVGLLAVAGGFTTITVAAIETVAGTSTVELGTEPINTLLAAVTLLVVGAPLWWRAWSRVQRLAGSSPLGRHDIATDLDAAQLAERRSPARRVYLFVLFGVGGLVALVSVLQAVVVALEDLLAGEFGRQSLSEMRLDVALVITAVAVAALHWSVYRADREALAGAARTFPDRITLVGVADATIVAALSERTDAKVQLWARRDGPTPPWAPDQLTEMLSGIDEAHVLVVAGPGGAEVIPVQD